MTHLEEEVLIIIHKKLTSFHTIKEEDQLSYIYEINKLVMAILKRNEITKYFRDH